MAGSGSPDRGALNIGAVLAALDHPARLSAVRRLAASEELTCQDILPDMTKSSASYHWRVLRESGVVEQRRGDSLSRWGERIRCSPGRAP